MDEDTKVKVRNLIEELFSNSISPETKDLIFELLLKK